jgi:hypothetical protein
MASGETLLTVLHDRIVAKHDSVRTEEAYAQWVRRYVRFHGRRHPRELGEVHVRDFLTHLARDERVSTSTQNQALAALLFLYREVLELPISGAMQGCGVLGRVESTGGRRSSIDSPTVCRSSE